MELFFTSNIDPLASFTLPEEESKHLIKVLRYGAGDKIALTDGSGKFYTAEIENTDPRHCLVKVTGVNDKYVDQKYNLHITITPPKNNERFEWFLEKTTEIGIDEITPLNCRRSERKELKLDRMNKILISALKQSWNGKLPLLHPMTDFKKHIENPGNGSRFICTMDADNFLAEVYVPGNDALILIGPEGDFHEEEIELAKKSGFIPVSLGKSRLRTETAGLMACAILTTMNAITNKI